MHSIETTKRLNSPESGNGRKYKGTLKEDFKVKVETSWGVEDVRFHLKGRVEHMTDKEIQSELGNCANGFHEMCVQSGRDMLDCGFTIKNKVKTKTYTLTEDEISDIADRELGAEGFWQDGEVDLKGALKGLEYMMERNHISRITYDFYSTGKEEWK